jgi:hypothetical protein
LAGYLQIHLPSQLDNSMRTEVKHKKDRLAELKAKEAKDAKSLTAAE